MDLKFKSFNKQYCRYKLEDMTENYYKKLIIANTHGSNKQQTKKHLPNISTMVLIPFHSLMGLGGFISI